MISNLAWIFLVQTVCFSLLEVYGQYRGIFGEGIDINIGKESFTPPPFNPIGVRKPRLSIRGKLS